MNKLLTTSCGYCGHSFYLIIFTSEFSDSEMVEKDAMIEG